MNTAEGGPYLRQEWTAKDGASAKSMVEKIQLVADEAKHSPEIQVNDETKVSAELKSQASGILPSSWDIAI